MARTLNSSKIRIKTNHRVLIIGATRDGKSTAAMKVLDIVNPKTLVVINQGAEPWYYELFGEARFDVDTSFPPVQHLALPIISDRRKYDKWLWPIIEHGNVTLFFDELKLMGEATNYGEALMYLYQMGARRGLGSIAINQRILTIPKFCFNQADHIIIAHQQGPDLKALEQETQHSWTQLIKNRKPYQFIHWSRLTADQPPQYLTGGA
jgi:energy-coupling factor transporter ATP-binding protein EcfA2